MEERVEVSDMGREGIRWYRLAADRGHIESQYRLGHLLLEGGCPVGGLKEDKKLGLEWCLKAAEAGHPSAQRDCGNAYLFGKGVEVDGRRGICISWQGC